MENIVIAPEMPGKCADRKCPERIRRHVVGAGMCVDDPDYSAVLKWARECGYDIYVKEVDPVKECPTYYMFTIQTGCDREDDDRNFLSRRIALNAATSRVCHYISEKQAVPCQDSIG